MPQTTHPRYVALPLLALSSDMRRMARLRHALIGAIGVVFLANAGLGVYHGDRMAWAGLATCGGGGGVVARPKPFLTLAKRLHRAL